MSSSLAIALALASIISCHGHVYAGFVSDADSELSYWGDEPDLHAHHSDEEPDAWQLHDATWQPAALAYSEAHMPAGGSPPLVNAH